MGFKFRKSIKIAPGIKLNFNKKSTGVTFGGKGVKYTINSKGKRTKSLGIPGTGLYYTTTTGGNTKKKSGKSTKTTNGIYINTENKENKNMNNKKWYQTSWGIILMLIMFFPAGIFLMWKYANWNKIIKIIISVIFAFFLLIGMFSEESETSSDTDNNTEDTSIMSIVDEPKTEITTENQSTTQEESTTQKEIVIQDEIVTQKPTTTQKQTTTNNHTTQNQTTTQKLTTTQKETTTENQTTTEQKVSEMVWIPKSGKRYHCIADCSGMKNPSRVTLEYAKSHDYTACENCY